MSTGMQHRCIILAHTAATVVCVLQFVSAPSSAALLHADHRSLDLTPTSQFMQISAEFAFVT
jgi:hypothetical protein